MGINEKLFVGGIAVLFIGLVVFGVLLWLVVGLWLRNKREQRKWESYQREQDRIDRFERQRIAWMELTKEQGERMERMVQEVKELSENCKRTEQDYARAKERMSKFNMKGEIINEA